MLWNYLLNCYCMATLANEGPGDPVVRREARHGAGKSCG